MIPLSTQKNNTEDSRSGDSYRMPNEVFTALISSSELQTGDDLECIGYSASNELYAITFIGRQEDYELEVEEFCTLINGKWETLQPTRFQIQVMEGVIDNKRIEILDSLDEQPEIIENWGIYSKDY